MTEREKLIERLRTTQMAPGDVDALGFKAAVVKMVLDTPGVIYLPTSGPEFEAAVERAWVRLPLCHPPISMAEMAVCLRAALSPESLNPGEPDA